MNALVSTAHCWIKTCDSEAGTKVGPDQLGPPVRVGSTRIDSDQLGSDRTKKKKNKIKLDSDQLGSTKNKIIKLAKLKI